MEEGCSCSWSWEGPVPTLDDHQRWNFINVGHKSASAYWIALGYYWLVPLKVPRIPSKDVRVGAAESLTFRAFPHFAKLYRAKCLLRHPQHKRGGCFPEANFQTPGQAFTWLYKHAVLRRPFQTLRTICETQHGAVQYGDPTGPVWATLMSLSCFSCFTNLSHLFLQMPSHCYPRNPTFSDWKIPVLQTKKTCHFPNRGAGDIALWANTQGSVHWPIA